MDYEILTEKPAPSCESLQLIERAIDQIQPDRASIREWYANYAQQQSTRLAHDVDYIKEHVPGGSRILEVGSIPLILTRALDELGYDVFGVDIAPERFQTVIAASGLNVSRVDIETDVLPFESDEFDAALFNEIFEHLRINPVRTLEEVHRVMKPGGTLFLSTPNLTSMAGWASLILKNKAFGDIYSEYKRLEPLGHVGHVRLYTPVEVCTLLEKIGFQVRQVIYRGTVQPRAFWQRCSVALLLAALPRLRPSFSVLAVKPAV